jgi:hypothetical protein
VTTEGDEDVSEPIVVRDGSRQITFDGDLIAAVSSAGGSKPRWSEYKLYKTVNSTYVLEKIGRSIVVHMPACPEIIDQLDRFQDKNPGRDPSDGWWFCESCTHGRVDITALLIEHDRHWVTITEDPIHVVDALYRKRDGARHLPRLILELLDQAARVDDSIAEAFRVERL